tara:strand:+ start:324 stop:1097 length:774 start_codon:yes stop_codon:yes gene_type:complete
MKITQSIVGDTVGFFKKGFMERWGFKEYYDINKPVVFFGIEGKQDIFLNHKGWKLLIPSTPHDIPDFHTLKKLQKTILVSKKNTEIPNNIICRKETIQIKDYSIYQPNTLGNKVYFYSGFKNGWSGRWGEELINEIQKNIDFEIFTTPHLGIENYFNINYLKENYYDKSFLNLNLSMDNGMTTVREMGLMGRKTITMRTHPQYNYPCIINCNNIKEIINVINEEAKKINTIQPSIESHTVGNEWLDLNYWLETHNTK